MAEDSGGVFTRLGRCRKAIALGLLAATAPLMLSCYGEFPLTRAVYRINGAVPTGVLKTVVFWVFAAAPVYGTAMLIDAVVLNLIEFWTFGVVSAGSVTDQDGNTVVLEPSADGREAVLTMSRDGKVTGRVRFVRVSDTRCEVFDSTGRLAGTAVRTPSGDLHLTDAQGQVVSIIAADQLASLSSI